MKVEKQLYYADIITNRNGKLVRKYVIEVDKNGWKVLDDKEIEERIWKLIEEVDE